jgi:hypothetical protein
MLPTSTLGGEFNHSSWRILANSRTVVGNGPVSSAVDLQGTDVFLDITQRVEVQGHCVQVTDAGALVEFRSKKYIDRIFYPWDCINSMRSRESVLSED